MSKTMPAMKLWVLEERGEGEKPFFRELVAFFPAANGKGFNGQFKAPLTGRLYLGPADKEPSGDK